jgi:hypothetical protein
MTFAKTNKFNFIPFNKGVLDSYLIIRINIAITIDGSIANK